VRLSSTIFRHLGLPTAALLGVVSASVLTGCEAGPSLSKSSREEGSLETPDLGPISQDLTLGALVDQAPVFAAASKSAPVIGYLHAGGRVARSEKAHPNGDCTEGWYQVAPKGYVCTEKSATIDPDHPTLLAMALSPKLEAELPYVYARTTKVTALYEKTASHGVELGGRLAKSTVMAIVGSWTAPDESLEPQRLGLLMDGQFVRADDLEPAAQSSFAGVDLRGDAELPVAYVVRRGVRMFDLSGSSPSRGRELRYHETIPLTGRFRTLSGLRFWATKDGKWVRHKDVTVVRRRHRFPDFATEDQKWIDISIVTGTLTAYEGTKPVFASIVSVGRDRLGDPETTASTARGSFRITEKHITRRVSQSEDEALRDAPWAFQLDSGQWLLASPRHDRFGIENTGGDIEVSPKDGAFLFRWAGPAIPAGWHGIVVDPAEQTLIVNVRN
jgi:hypothetical protein